MAPVLVAIFVVVRSATSSSVVLSMDNAWRFSLKGHAPLPPGGSCNASSFPINYSNVQCMGLHPEAQYADPDGCRSGCCADATCEVYQWCTGSDCDGARCWIGKANDCNHKPNSKDQFIAFGRKVAPTPAPGPNPSGSHCTSSWCMAKTDDSNWRLLDHVPHDFVVEGNVSASASDKSHGFKPYGIGYYRKHFDAPEASAELSAQWLTFDGVQRDSDTYLNGELLGHHDSGYTNFRYDVSGKLLPKNNVLAVKADATHPDGWWYDGGGIYRHVWLELAPAVHFAPDGIFANITVPNVVSGGLKGDAVIDAQAEILNSGSAAASDVVVAFSVVDTSTGKEVCTTSTPAPSTHVPATSAIQYNTSTLVRAELKCAGVNLWSDIHPVLYSLKATISVGGHPGGDSRTVTIGFRRIYFDSDKGLLLNDVPTKIRGLANHQDFAGVGVAVPDSLQAFRVSKLKEMGANGWRCAHNPPTPGLLDEADKQGFLVWDENHRNLVDGGQWIEDLHALLRRDRNHPSVVLWSLCNEALCEGFNADHARVLYPIVKAFDNGPNARPVTAAMNGGYGDDFSKVLDVVGINYHPSGYEQFHHSMGAITGSETASALSDRGEYYTNKTAAYMSAYDTNKPGWGSTAEVAWQAVDKYAFVSATFIWTGFDYKGEPTP